MANVSPNRLKIRFPFSIEIRPAWRDHFFEGQVVFPAVEAMAVLARLVKNHDPDASVGIIDQARFPRMLILQQDAEYCEAHVEMETQANGVRASLLTLVKTKTAAMTRTLEHARVTFDSSNVFPEPSLAFREARRLEGDCIQVPAASIYRDLIPFGPSFRNIVGDLSVAKDGALADISGGGDEDAFLGSPYALDATMHAACVWGQRFAGIVPFPVGMARRMIYRPTRKGASYLARIRPVETSRASLTFNAWIFDQNGILYESISGLCMRDVSQGRVKPPSWIKDDSWKK